MKSDEKERARYRHSGPGRRRLPRPQRPGTRSRSHSSPIRGFPLMRMCSSLCSPTNISFIEHVRFTDLPAMCCARRQARYPPGWLTRSFERPVELQSLNRVRTLRTLLPYPLSTAHPAPQYYASRAAVTVAAAACRPPAPSPHSYPVRLAARAR
jgi:hypothetical protein